MEQDPVLRDFSIGSFLYPSLVRVQWPSEDIRKPWISSFLYHLEGDQSTQLVWNQGFSGIWTFSAKPKMVLTVTPLFWVLSSGSMGKSHFTPIAYIISFSLPFTDVDLELNLFSGGGNCHLSQCDNCSLKSLEVVIKVFEDLRQWGVAYHQVARPPSPQRPPASSYLDSLPFLPPSNTQLLSLFLCKKFTSGTFTYPAWSKIS